MTPDDIARRAFELFCERAHQHGHDLDDWLQAECELASERAYRELSSAEGPLHFRVKRDRRVRRETPPFADRRRTDWG